MTGEPLSKADVLALIERLRPRLRATDHPRLDAVVKAMRKDGRFRLGPALATLYPGKGRGTSLALFRQLRDRIDLAADAASVACSLVVPSDRRASPDERWCWFEGEGLAAAAAARYSSDEAGSPQRVPQSVRAFVDPDRVRPAQFAADGRRVLRYFVSYAHADRKLAEDLLRRLRPKLATAKRYQFEGWIDGDLVLGDEWSPQIQRAIDASDVGLLLVSSDFLARPYIVEHELPRFMPLTPERCEPGRCAIPVGLRRISFSSHTDWRGLDQVTVMLDADGKSFDERAGQRRETFVDELFERLMKAIERAFPPAPPPAPTVPLAEEWENDTVAWRRQVERAGEADRFVEPNVAPLSLDKFEEASEARTDAADRPDALQALLTWATDPIGPPFCALFGEYGMGKTTTCRKLVETLLGARERDHRSPLAIYLDLAHVGRTARDEPDLLEIVRRILAKSHRVEPGTRPPTAEDVVRLVQRNGAIAVFDGLDEVLVHLEPDAGQRFTRQLWRVLPPRRAKGSERAPKEVPGKLLIACRSHYFRTIRDAKTHFTGEDREDILAAHYRGYVLLPFSDEQILRYLELTFSKGEATRVLGLIRSIHDLGDVATRPYTLRLITEQVPRIEALKAAGKSVTGVVLYREVVQSCLDRDTGRHQFTPGHKHRLLEHLAAQLHLRGVQVWEVEHLEQWLIDFLEQNPRVAAHYHGKDREILKEDLRTASLLVRPGESGFRFAHASLQEFFLASFLHRALVERRPEDWGMPVPSRETLDFLGQLLAESEAKGGEEIAAALATLDALRDARKLRAGELAFAYFLRATAQAYPHVSGRGFQLDGANLAGLVIAGRSADDPLDLAHADLRRADLSGTRFEHVCLERADLSVANLDAAELLDVRASGARFVESDLTGVVARDVDFRGTDFTGMRAGGTQWVRATLEGATGYSALDGRIVVASSMPPLPSAHAPRDLVRAPDVGNVGRVNSAALSPDGARAVSASDDGRVRVWDADGGRPLRVLEGHRGGVWSCAFSADGARVVSAGADGRVRIWGAESGEPPRVLEGHEGLVRSCASSSDGARVVSGGDDGRVRIWDAESGETLRVLEGHRGGVWTCSFSSDGARVVSAGTDRRVRIWDAESGKPLHVLEGHEGLVRSCAFSSDGTRVVSAGEHGRVRIWDTDSGKLLRVLEGHRGRVWSCAFSSDGARVVSAGDDGRVRIWDTESGKSLRVLEGHRGSIRSCAFSSDGARVVSAGTDGRVRIWDAESGKPLRVLEGHKGSARSCAFSSGGVRVGATGGDGRVRIWDAESGKPLRVLDGHDGWVRSCAFSSDGARVVSAGTDGRVRTWDADSGKPLRVLEGHEGGVWSCAFSSDGARVVSAGDDGRVRIWDAESGKSLRVLDGHEGWVRSCAFSFDGTRVVSAGTDRRVRIWDAESGKSLRVLKGHEGGVWSCAFSSDGARVVSAGSNGSVRIWDAESGEPLRVLDGHEGWVHTCAFSSDGARVVSAGEDGRVRIWDTDSGKLLHVLEGHRGRVWSCAFSSDGARVVSACTDGSVTIWDAESGSARIVIHHFRGAEWASLDPRSGAVRACSASAWRSLGWVGVDPRDGRTKWFPAETLGPLPVVVEPASLSTT